MLIQRTGSAEFPDKLKVMLSGDPKSGKTTCLGTVPNIIVADTEFRANNLQSIAHLNVPYVQVDSTAKLNNLRMILANDSTRAQQAEALGMPSIDAVAIDTLDTLQKLLKDERKRAQHGKWDRDDWGWLKEEMIKIVEGFTALPLHVFLLVHTKTETIGKGDDAYTIVLPGLEGAIAREIAGMVGYSLRAFREEQVLPNGSKKMVYLLQTEGDETYGFLGNRAAGSLPTVIEPSFRTIYENAMANRPKSEPTAVAAVAPPPQYPAAPPGQGVLPPAPPAAPPAPPAAATPPAAQPAPEAAAQVQPPVQNGAPQGAPQGGENPPAQPPPDQRPADDQPMTAAAMQHVKRVFDACGLAFPEDKIKGLTLGQGRAVVMLFNGAQKDEAEGKLDEGRTAVQETVDYLRSLDLVSDQPAAEPKAEKVVEPKIDGTIDEVKAFATDLERTQAAYDLEISKGDKARKSLISELLNRGAKPAQEGGEAPAPVQTDVQTAPPAPAEQPPSNPAPAPADAPVTEAAQTPPHVAAEQADQAATAAAVGAVQQGLGGEVITHESADTRPCQKCGNPVDDLDIARLSEGRFNEWLCVKDYVERTKQ